MGWKIEKASPGDFLAVAALDRVAWPVREDVFIPDGEHVWRLWCGYALVLVARAVDQPPLPESGTVGGALLMFPALSGEQLLHKIMVHPACRGAGLGSDLMRAGLAEADREVLLTVDPANEPAVKLYQRFGFTIAEHVRGYYRPHEDRYLMVYRGEK
jgi:GNAT superfamily N-acetyltransferase